MDYGNWDRVDLTDIFEQPTSASDGVPPLGVPIVLEGVRDNVLTLIEAVRTDFENAIRPANANISIRMGTFGWYCIYYTVLLWPCGITDFRSLSIYCTLRPNVI